MTDWERVQAIIKLNQLARDEADLRVLSEEMHLLLWELEFVIDEMRSER